MTPKQRKQAEELIRRGHTAEYAVKQVRVQAPPTPQAPDPTFGSAVGNAVSELNPISLAKDFGKDVGSFGLVNATKTLKLRAAGRTGRALESIAGGVLETADDLTGEVVSDAVEPLVSSAVNSPLGQGTIQGARAINEATQGLAGDLFSATSLAGIGGGTKALFGGVRRLKPIARTKAGSLVDTIRPKTPKNRLKKGSVEDIVKGTDENFVQKIVSDENDILTAAEKRAAVELDSEIGNKILKASKEGDSFEGLDNPGAVDVAMTEAFKEIKAYKNKLKATGKNIGEIKDSLLQLPIKKGIRDVQALKNDILIKLEKKGATIKDGKFVKTKNSPLENRDLVKIQEFLGGLDEIKGNKSLRDIVHQIEKIDNSGIKFGVEPTISKTLDDILKATRKTLKGIRDKNLTKAQISEFDKFTSMSRFLDEFRDKPNAVRLMLKRADSQLSGDLKFASEEIAKVTGGQRIDRIGEVLSSVLRGGLSNKDKSLLGNMFSNQTDVLTGFLSPKTLATKTIGTALRKTIAKDRVSELEKFINTTVKSSKKPVSPKKQSPQVGKSKTKVREEVNQPSPNPTPKPTASKPKTRADVDSKIQKSVALAKKDGKSFDEWLNYLYDGDLHPERLREFKGLHFRGERNIGRQQSFGKIDAEELASEGNLSGGSVYFSDDVNTAADYAFRGRGPQMVGSKVKDTSDVIIIDLSDLRLKKIDNKNISMSEIKDAQEFERAFKEGYDGIDAVAQHETAVWNTDKLNKIKTKSQLRKIWQEAHKTNK